MGVERFSVFMIRAGQIQSGRENRAELRREPGIVASRKDANFLSPNPAFATAQTLCGGNRWPGSYPTLCPLSYDDLRRWRDSSPQP